MRGRAPQRVFHGSSDPNIPCERYGRITNENTVANTGNMTATAIFFLLRRAPSFRSRASNLSDSIIRCSSRSNFAESGLGAKDAVDSAGSAKIGDKFGSSVARPHTCCPSGQTRVSEFTVRSEIFPRISEMVKGPCVSPDEEWIHQFMADSSCRDFCRHNRSTDTLQKSPLPDER